MKLKIDFITIHNALDFLSDSIRLQYTNFIYRHQDRFGEYLSFDEAIQRLRMEEPIEYVFNLAEFCGNEFYVDKRCLIPRPETEILVQKTVDFLEKNDQNNFTIIDIGTGSGAIILTLAQKMQKSHRYIGIDISEDALTVAEINREEFGLHHVTLLHESFQKFDFTSHENVIICANLPYIPNSEVLQPSVANYEPHLALFGGDKGDELNIILMERVQPLQNVKAIIMEGYNGEISETIFPR